MWPLLILLGGASVILYVFKKPAAAAAPSTGEGNIILQNPSLYAQIRTSLEMDLKTGGNPLTPNTTIDQVATFYTKAYLTLSDNDLRSVIQNAYANKYALTGRILDNRNAPPTISISL
jgi:hypothetical protein